MSKKIPPRPAQTKKPKPPMSERLAGGDPWDKETKPDDEPSYLRSSYSIPRKALDPSERNRYTEEDGQADNYTDFAGRALREREDGPEERVPKDVQEQFNKAAHSRFQVDHEAEMRDMQARHIANQLARLQRRGAKHGVDFAPRLAAFLRDAEAELAEKRRGEAA